MRASSSQHRTAPAADDKAGEQPAQVVVTEQRMVDQRSLERWLPKAMARVLKAAGSLAAGTAEIAAAPREAYRTDFCSAAAGDKVFEVAFPVR